jgi:N-acetyl-anhydromuramyl-L-alanine amidase AmpD
MPLIVDQQYFNKTPNKWGRKSERLRFVICHETASPNPANPHGTLRYNLNSTVGSSYHYLIDRSGKIFWYVDEAKWIAYHAGVKSQTRVDGQFFKGWDINAHSIGVEIDGRNNGEPATAAQIASFGELIAYFAWRYGIPADANHYLMHKAVAPGYKSDARGYSVTGAISLARSILHALPKAA